MKNPLLIALIACVGLSVLDAKTKPTPTPTPTPKDVVVKQGMVCRTKQKDNELKDWIGGILTETATAKGELKSALATNEQTSQKLGEATLTAQNLANENAAAKAIVKQVNAYWGLGAFAYGIKRLFSHLLWVAVALVVLSIAIPLLKGVFPWLAPVAKLIMIPINIVVNFVSNLFKKKP